MHDRTDGVFEMAFAIPSSHEHAGFDPGETAPRISRPAGSEENSKRMEHHLMQRS